MEEKKINTRIVFSIVAVLLLIAVVAGATYAYFSATGSSEAQTVTTATLDLAFDDSTAIINATNITPIYQSEIETKAAKKSFTVTNNGTQSMYLKMQLTDITIDTALKNVWFRWALYEEGTRIGIGSFYGIGSSTEVFMQQNMVIEPGTDNAKDYDLYIWIEDSDEEQNTMQGKTFSGKVTVNGSMTEYEDVVAVHRIPEESGDGITEQSYYYPTNISELNTPDDISLLSYSVNFYFEKFTNVKNLAINSGAYIGIIPISVVSVTCFNNLVLDCDMSFLTNLESLTGITTCSGNEELKLPKSLKELSNSSFGQYTYDITTFNLSNLVNLTTVTDSFTELTSSQTVILPASIKDTVTITNSFGSATVVYQ